MRFLIDAQLPPALAGWLREAGHEASHVEDDGLRDAENGAIWAHALKTGAIIVTKDEDFAARSIQTESAPMIVWLRVATRPTACCACGSKPASWESCNWPDSSTA